MLQSTLPETEIRVDVTGFRYDITDLLSRVALTGCRCVIEKKGKEYVCIISISDLNKLRNEKREKTGKRKEKLIIDARAINHNIDPKKLYTHSETAKILDISYYNLRKRVDLGEIKPIRLGGVVRFSGEEIKQFLKRQTTIYDIQGAAKRLGLSAYVVRKLIIQGKLQASRSHKKYLITHTEIDHFLNELIK